MKDEGRTMLLSVTEYPQCPETFSWVSKQRVLEFLSRVPIPPDHHLKSLHRILHDRSPSLQLLVLSTTTVLSSALDLPDTSDPTPIHSYWLEGQDQGGQEAQEGSSFSRRVDCVTISAAGYAIPLHPTLHHAHDSISILTRPISSTARP
jgi:hypothetical protein